MRLIEKIPEIWKYADSFITHFMIPEDRKQSMRNDIFQNQLREIINNDIMNKNPDDLFDEYKEYFSCKRLPLKIIESNTVFYRGRIGNDMIRGAEDDWNKSFIIPYHQNEIEAPPPLYATGGRFNREGVSYLYLASSIETCLAEVHLSIGQYCSIGEFECQKKMSVIDLTKFHEGIELQTWHDILMQPVYSDTKYVYNKTRFIADVLKNINRNGIYFESVQTTGCNIVCFDHSLFKLKQYSEKIYTATKIKYDYIQVEDAIREYAKNGKRKYINSYNSDEEEKNDKILDYLNDWIKNEEHTSLQNNDEIIQS